MTGRRFKPVGFGGKGGLASPRTRARAAAGQQQTANSETARQRDSESGRKAGGACLCCLVAYDLLFAIPTTYPSRIFSRELLHVLQPTSLAAASARRARHLDFFSRIRIYFGCFRTSADAGWFRVKVRARALGHWPCRSALVALLSGQDADQRQERARLRSAGNSLSLVRHGSVFRLLQKQYRRGVVPL